MNVERWTSRVLRLQDVEAEREKGTAKGRSLEGSVVEALDRIAQVDVEEAEPGRLSGFDSR